MSSTARILKFLPAAALVLPLVLHAAPGLAREKHLLIVSGYRPASIALDLPGPLKFNLEKMQVDTTGSYAAWMLVETVKARGRTFHFPVAGAIHVPAFDKAGNFFGPLSLGSRTRRGGTYRLYLSTDGPTKIAIPARGLDKTIRVVPSSKVRSQGEVANLLSATGGGGGMARTPVALRDNTFTVMSYFAAHERNVVTAVQACMVPRERPVCDNGALGDGVRPRSSGTTVASTNVGHQDHRSYGLYSWGWQNGFPGPGKYFAQYKTATVSQSTDIIAFTWTLNW